MSSKSAKNKLVVLADLPNSSVPNIGAIPSHYLFPIIGSLNAEPPFFLHSDGSIFQLFEIDSISMPEIDKMVSAMPEACSLQIYRLSRPVSSPDRYFIAIRAEIDYSGMDLGGSRILSHFMSSYSVYEEMLDKITRERYERVLKMLPERSRVSGMRENPLYTHLCDYEMEGNFAFTKYAVKSNISAILSGKSKHSAVFSINNLDGLPLNTGILKGKEFIEVVTLAKPSQEHTKEIERTISVNKEILSAIRPADIETRAIEVDTMRTSTHFNELVKDAKAGVFFGNVSFCIRSEESLSDLREKFAFFDEQLYAKGIVLYCHSNSARAQYISLFPGNAVYGEHWNKVYRRFALMLTSKVMAL